VRNRNEAATLFLRGHGQEGRGNLPSGAQPVQPAPALARFDAGEERRQKAVPGELLAALEEAE
jgi:hypothetical protein